MALSVDQLITPPTAAQTLSTFITILKTIGIPADTWRVGGVARSILSVVATTYAAAAAVNAEAIKAGFLETASGDWLTLLAKNTFGVTRTPATFATGQVQMKNTGGGVFTFGAEQCRYLRSSDGTAYTNTAGFTINPGDTLLIDIHAAVIGIDSSSAVGTIDSLETKLPLVTVTNLAAVVGADAQTDDELRTACQNKRESISDRGVRGAYANAVDIATHMDGTPLNINRVSVSASSSTGVVTVYCASPSGAPDSGDLTIAAQSIEDNARPDSVTVFVDAVTEVPITLSLVIWAKRTAGVDAAGFADLANKALIAAFQTYPIGGIPKPPATQGYLYSDYLAGVIENAHVAIYDVDGLGADTALSPGQVATLATTITASNVRIVDVP